jgi:hypothetical protein
MNINELFEKIQDKFIPEDLKGEFALHGNCIIWEYNLDNDCEEIPAPSEDDDELQFDFESESPEELLLETYNDDLELIEGLFDELEESDNWSFSEPEIIENVISFKIF